MVEHSVIYTGFIFFIFEHSTCLNAKVLVRKTGI